MGVTLRYHYGSGFPLYPRISSRDAAATPNASSAKSISKRTNLNFKNAYGALKNYKITLTIVQLKVSLLWLWPYEKSFRKVCKMSSSKKDKILGLTFFALTAIFLVAANTNQVFFNWVFERHHNQWSWYIRPIFLVPFCYFAYKRSWAGIAITVFCLFTSMFWFRKPVVLSPDVVGFLQFEKDWLLASWKASKIIFMATIPISFFALGLAFWKRSLIIGLGVIFLMATGKIIWSILNAGEAGKAILIPAILGLIICSILVYVGFKKLEKTVKTKQ